MRLWRRFNVWLGNRLYQLPPICLWIAEWATKTGAALHRKHAEDPQQRLDLGDD